MHNFNLNNSVVGSRQWWLDPGILEGLTLYICAEISLNKSSCLEQLNNSQSIFLTRCQWQWLKLLSELFSSSQFHPQLHGNYQVCSILWLWLQVCHLASNHVAPILQFKSCLSVPSKRLTCQAIVPIQGLDYTKSQPQTKHAQIANQKTNKILNFRIPENPYKCFEHDYPPVDTSVTFYNYCKDNLGNIYKPSKSEDQAQLTSCCECLE